MKRTSKKKHIIKNQAVKNSKKKQKDKQKSRLKTNHNHLFLGFILGVAVFIINYLFFIPDDSVLPLVMRRVATDNNRIQIFRTKELSEVTQVLTNILEKSGA